MTIRNGAFWLPGRLWSHLTSISARIDVSAVNHQVFGRSGQTGVLNSSGKRNDAEGVGVGGAGAVQGRASVALEDVRSVGTEDRRHDTGHLRGPRQCPCDAVLPEDRGVEDGLSRVCRTSLCACAADVSADASAVHRWDFITFREAEPHPSTFDVPAACK